MIDTLVLILSVVVGVLAGNAITWGIRSSSSRHGRTDALNRHDELLRKHTIQLDRLTHQVDAIAHHLEQEADG